ncbi:MAG: ribosome small subunit-dependent GTPase A [Gemmatimonadota bacterium]|nr:ribosome small subunit-dependent GTPase A [Gemmatimonadota bacterium]MDP7031424.1 ribosome small subunit-dependent GTPase A [Gemmatimonadota bacterium]
MSLRRREVSVVPEGEERAISCALRRSTRVPHPDASPVAVGDRVRFLADGAPPHVLTEVLPRETQLSRIRRGREEQVFCANVDLAVVVASADQPPFKPRLVDRYLVAAGRGGLSPVLVLNKMDLSSPPEVDRFLAVYRGLGIPCAAVSAETGEGLPELAEILAGKTSVFSGQSGVGKSSLLNRLLPEENIPVGDVHAQTGKGRHTTTSSMLYDFPFGGSVIDTPGVRSFLLAVGGEEDVARFFPEIAEAGESCAFSNCRHDGDKGCEVEGEVRAGRVSRERLESFRTLMEEVRSGSRPGG